MTGHDIRQKDGFQRRVVCAANRSGDDIILGIRHWDAYMHLHATQAFGDDELEHPFEQGFLDNQGTFLSRTEAWKVAKAADQIIRRVGGDSANGGTLYSENLY